MNEVVAIVVTYNRKALLCECIDNLLSSEVKCDIIVVDNNSTDGTGEFIEKNYSEKVLYCNTGENLGGAGGFNYGIKKAYELGYPYLWLMDDDTMVRPDSLSKLLLCDEQLQRRGRGEYGFLSSQAKWIDGTRCVMNYHYIASDWEEASDLLQNKMLKITMATFVSFFIRREVVKKLGLPIKEYFIWGDDTEYSGRISREYDCYYCFDGIVVHKMKSNQSSEDFANIEEIDRIHRMKLSIRNDMCTAKKIGGKETLRCIYGKIKMLAKCLLMRHCKYRKEKIMVLLSGILSGVLFYPKIETVE